MKYILTSVVLAALSFPSLVSSEETTMENLVKRDGLFYKKFTETPFTGKTTGPIQGSFKDGVAEGPWVNYYDNGQLQRKGDYKNSKREGPWEAYHDNGQLQGKGDFKNGEMEGPWVFFFKNGQLDKTGAFKDGKEEGPSTFYFEDGQLLG